MIEILKNEGVFNNKYYVAWTTTDKQTGVDHYEIQESDLPDSATQKGWLNSLVELFKPTPKENWKIVTSPYVLEDQTLKKVIRIKAIDKAGNERTSEYFPKLINTPDNSRYIVGFVVLLMVIICIAFLLRRRSKNKQT